MILNYLKEFCNTLLEMYAKEILHRDLKKHEIDIYYLYNEYKINHIIEQAKLDISSNIRSYMIKLKEKENE